MREHYVERKYGDVEYESNIRNKAAERRQWLVPGIPYYDFNPWDGPWKFLFIRPSTFEEVYTLGLTGHGHNYPVWRGDTKGWWYWEIESQYGEKIRGARFGIKEEALAQIEKFMRRANDPDPPVARWYIQSGTINEHHPVYKGATPQKRLSEEYDEWN